MILHDVSTEEVGHGKVQKDSRLHNPILLNWPLKMTKGLRLEASYCQKVLESTAYCLLYSETLATL